MIFQLDYVTVMIFVLVSYLGTSLILFIADTYLMQIYASSKKWDESFKIPIRINIIWFALSLIIGIPLSLLYGDSVMIDFVKFGINMVVGIFLAYRYYKKEIGETIPFILILQFILFVIGVIFGNLFSLLTLSIIGALPVI